MCGFIKHIVIFTVAFLDIKINVVIIFLKQHNADCLNSRYFIEGVFSNKNQCNLAPINFHEILLLYEIIRNFF